MGKGGETHVHVETCIVASIGIGYDHLFERSSSLFGPVLESRVG
jgi:hypothetical protein